MLRKLHVMLRLRMGGALPLFPVYAFMVWTGQFCLVLPLLLYIPLLFFF